MAGDSYRGFSYGEEEVDDDSYERDPVRVVVLDVEVEPGGVLQYESALDKPVP